MSGINLEGTDTMLFHLIYMYIIVSLVDWKHHTLINLQFLGSQVALYQDLLEGKFKEYTMWLV